MGYAEDTSETLEGVDDFVEAPVNPRPDYPSVSLLKNESGIVILKVLVNADGTAKQVEIEKSSGFNRLDHSAKNTVEKWRFHPVNPTIAATSGRATVAITFKAMNGSSMQEVKDPVLARSTPKLATHWTLDQKGCQLFDYHKQTNASYIWSGACKNNLIEGAGQVKVIRDGRIISTIEGSYHLGRLEGEAVMHSTDQTEYRGSFLHGLKHGKGVQTWKHGLRYEGDFNSNHRTGHGMISYPEGVHYEGDFLKGAPIAHVMLPPKFAFKEPLHLPEEVVSADKQGSVIVQAWITAQGNIKDVEVLQSDHPAYEKEVLRALASATISPATLQGQAVPVLFCQRFKFGFNDMQFKPYELEMDTAAETVFIENTPSLPEKLTGIKVQAPLVYPLEQFLQNKTAVVSAIVTIDPNGQVQTVDVQKSSSKEFTYAMRAMLMSSTFTPTMRDQQPVWSRIKLQRTFDRASGDIFFDKHVLRLLGKIKEGESAIFKLADLDRKPHAIFHPLPATTDRDPLKQDEKVMLSFYIDKTGHVQLPRVLKSNDPTLGWLAITAVSRWQFEPPTVKGEPVDVTVNLPIVFSATTSNAAAN